jgi:hypothetical protein
MRAVSLIESLELFRNRIPTSRPVGCNEETALQTKVLTETRRRMGHPMLDVRRRQDHQSRIKEPERTNLVRSHTSTSWPSRNSKALAIAS